MSTQLTDDDPIWGTPDTAPQRWRLRETALAVGVAIVIAGLGGAAIYSATDGGARGGQPPFGHNLAGAPGNPPGMPNSSDMPGGPGSPHAALHGEYVTADGAGGYVTTLTQSGTITALSSTSVTVRSVDDFTQTYTLPGDRDSSSVAVNDKVLVTGSRDGDMAHLTSIRTEPGPDGQGGGAGPGDTTSPLRVPAPR